MAAEVAQVHGVGPALDRAGPFGDGGGVLVCLVGLILGEEQNGGGESIGDLAGLEPVGGSGDGE
jgi:hypothetical protein